MAPGLKVTAPASISNINCGFDVLGAATEILADEMIGRKTAKPGVYITEITGNGKHMVTKIISKNTAGVALTHFLEYGKITKEGIEITIHKKIPPGSGLGSSASSACAAVVLANALFDGPLSPRELLPLAILGERAASHALHADNVAPCLLGGIVLVRDTLGLDIQQLHTPEGLYLTIVMPELRILTAASRSIFKSEVPLRMMVKQSANLGAFVLALERSDFTLMGNALQDHVIEPQRAHLIPGYDDVRDAAYSSGVIGCGISGSGPALFAFSQNTIIAEEAGLAMQQALARHHVFAHVEVTKISATGATLQ